MEFLANIFTQLLIILNTNLGSLGLAIIVFTLIIRAFLWPITANSLKAQKKMKKVQPELKKLNKKHKGDKPALQKAQMELYKKYNINPMAGCLPQILQIFILIVLYQALQKFLTSSSVDGGSTMFFWMDLQTPDKSYFLPIMAVLSQLVLSIMIAPGAEVRDIVPNKSKSKKIQKANVKEEDTAEMAASMQQQMLFIMPIMTGFFAASFPAGIALYWVVTTIFSVGQQYYISGWGGITTYYQRALVFVRKKTK